MPFIVGTLHSPSCLQRLEKRPQELLQKIDFLEVRLDFLCDQTLPSSWPLPVIATARDRREGGEGNLSLTQRRRLLEESLLWASAIDVELRSTKQLASTMANAKASGKVIICSFHDFKTVPSLARLEEKVFRAKEAGATFFKVACMIPDEEALIRLLSFQLMMKDVFPVATMGMGEGGKLSRLLLAAAGSALNYGWLYSPHVAGQWSVEELALQQLNAAKAAVEKLNS